jgi:hypothetical protein
MRLGCHVTLETIRIATLFLAHLAVKLELLQALGLDALGNVFGSSLFGFRHVAVLVFQ